MVCSAYSWVRQRSLWCCKDDRQPPPFPAVPSLSAADFNGDGNPDIALLGSPGSAVEIFLGHGDGTFAARVSIGNGLSSAGGMATGDFNGDGKADIAVVSSTSIAVLLGKSVGIFAPPIVTATNLTAPASLVLALGDINRDSRLDAVVTDQNGGMQVMLGNGGGGFNRKPVFYDYLSAAPPNVIAIGDFNGDGKPDLVAGIGADVPEFVFAQVCPLFGYGDGSFDLNSPCYDAPVLVRDRVDLSGFTQMLVTNLNGKAGLVFSGRSHGSPDQRWFRRVVGNELRSRRQHRDFGRLQRR